jgi:hypothetical protein
MNRMKMLGLLGLMMPFAATAGAQSDMASTHSTAAIEPGSVK